MQGFGAQTHLFSEVPGPQQFEQTKKRCPMDLRKLLTPFLLTPLQRDFSGPKKPWQPQTWQDLTRFSPLDFSLLSPDFRGLVLLNYTENLEKKQKIQWRASSGDGAPKLQISVPCRGRTCPELLNNAKSCLKKTLRIFLRGYFFEVTSRGRN